MTETEQLQQLKEMLSSDLIRKRKAGIEMAAGMLANGIQREAVRGLLGEIIKTDSIKNVQDAAQAVLAADDERHKTGPAAPPGYVFGARCPNGHVSYYDKREYCRKGSSGVWRTVTRGGKDVQEILLRCKTPGCPEEFYVEVDCEGY